MAALAVWGAGGALGATAAYRLALPAAAARQGGGSRGWVRTNHRGEPVSLLQGPAYAVAATVGAVTAPGVAMRARLAAGVALSTAAVLGAYDDLAGSGDDRGLRGHLRALRRGEVTTGAVKLAGLSVSGLVAGALIRENPLDALLAGAVVAGSANLVNLLDLRPGRATKAAVLLTAPALVRCGSSAALCAAPLGAALALLPGDLRERSMLGDCGANTMGAVLGVAIAACTTRPVLAAHLVALVVLTVASERVSFTRVIEATPGLRTLDRLGRRPPA